MEEKSIILNSKRCYATAFPEPKTEHEAETSRLTKQLCFGTKREPEADQEVKTEDKVKPAKFMLFGVDLLSPPTIKQPIQEKNPKDALFAYIESTLGADERLSEVQLIMERELTMSDIKPDQNRLSIPGGQIKNIKFLRDYEKRLLQLRNSKGRWNRIRVKVFGSSMRQERQLHLARWNYAKTKNGEQRGWRYALINGWRHLRTDNDLEEGQQIQLWSFRINRELCFAIVGLERE